MHPLVQKIAGLQRKLVLRERATAACWILVTLLGAAFVLSLVDYLFRFADVGLRIMATGVFLGAIGWSLFRWRKEITGGRRGPLAVARQVEGRFPQLGDSLASSVEFLRQSEDDPTAGSPQLRRIVVAETQTILEVLPLEEVIERRPLQRAVAWAAAVVGLFLALFVLDASSVGTALARLAAPFGSAEWPREHYLEFIDPPTRLAVGETFEAQLIDRSGPLPDEVRVEFRDAGRGRERLTETHSPAGDSLLVRREDMRRSFSFRAVGGDDETMRWHHVEVAEPPRLESLTLTIHPPAYSARPAATAERHLAALAGSGIEVAGVASEPLGAARILLDDGQAIEAELRPVAGESPPRGFVIGPASWLATRSGAWQLELKDASGVSGIVRSGQLRVEPDAPPGVDWRRPNDDVDVLASAVLPLELVARDDLAVRAIEALYEIERGPGSASGDCVVGTNDESQGGRIPLYRGPDTPETSEGETQVAAQKWSLAPLKLSPGDQLLLRGEATDYRPEAGQTPSPRRVAIITIGELDERLAERQTEIVRLLERATSAQRAARDEVKRLEIKERDAGLTASDLGALQVAELNQRRIAAMLADPLEGAPGRVNALLEVLAINQVGSPEVEQAMRSLRSALDELAKGALDTAERELTRARKLAASGETQRDPSPEPGDSEAGLPPWELEQQTADALTRLLSTAGAAQEEVIAVVDQLVARLSEAADYSRFVRELSQIIDEQKAHVESTRNRIALVARPLEIDELTREQLAELNQAAAGQESLAKRFENVQQGLARLADELDLKDAEASNLLKQAVALGGRLAIAANMQTAARELATNRVGRALELETRVVANVEELLKFLRQRDEPPATPADALAALKRAEEELARLREQLDALRSQVTGNESRGRPADERVQLGQQQGRLQENVARLAQQMQQAGAQGASQSARSAADRLNNRPPGDQRGAPRQPGSQQQLDHAKQDLDEAARQLAEQRAQEELNLSLEFINQFRADLEKMIESQKAVIAETAEVDMARATTGRLTAADAGKLELLAVEERRLADRAVANSELLFGLTAVRLSLEEAQRRLLAAADLLAARESGPSAQQAERHALARLEGMKAAFEQTAAEAQKPPEGGNPPGQPNQGQQPPRRPAFELLEIKVLRMLQVELNERTDQLRQRQEAAGQGGAAEQAALDRQARELADEQRRLAELVEELLTRNNERQQSD
jgi:hypothetical protein